MSKIVIEAGKAERHYWKDAWRHRELIYFLAWRDILVRYKQTFIGVVWALLRPLLTMLVFTIVFGRLAKLPSDDLPYPLLIFIALLPWQFFASAFSEVGGSVVGNANMISKIYFPRVIIPTSTILVALVDFLISMFFLLFLMTWYGVMPSWRMVFIPILVFLVAVTALGAGLWIAALNVKYRDFRYVVPFIIQMGLYISPVGFSSAIVPEKWRMLYSLNPMVGVIDAFRWTISGGTFYFQGLVISIGMATMLLVTGMIYFRKTEKSFADII